MSFQVHIVKCAPVNSFKNRYDEHKLLSLQCEQKSGPILAIGSFQQFKIANIDSTVLKTPSSTSGMSVSHFDSSNPLCRSDGIFKVSRFTHSVLYKIYQLEKF